MRYRFEDVLLDRRAGLLERNGKPVPLEPRTFHVLCVLLERAGEVVGHATLTDLVWNGVFVSPHSLTEAISQLRRALDDDFRHPRLIETAHRRGYRFVAPVERLHDDEHRWRIPARLIELFGRDRDVHALVEILIETRLVTLVGPGGVGKTQLALEAARRFAPRCSGGAVLVDLASATTAADVERAIADVAGAVQRRGADAGPSIGSMLRDTEALIVMDNCERVHDSAGRLVQSILGAAPAMRVLATSQRALNVAGEVLVRVPPLPCTPSGEEDVAPAVDLFRARATAVLPEFVRRNTDTTIVARICEYLDGLPLAIELAAARVTVLSLAQILERLDSRFDLLRQQGPSLAARHRTLTAVIEWSTSLLDRDESELLEALSAFAGGWDLSAALAVTGPAVKDAEVLTRLSALVDKSLVLADTGRVSARYRLLDSVRLFALQRLDHSSRGTLVRDRMVAHYVQLTERADHEWYSGGGPLWNERLLEERANIRAACEWAVRVPGRVDSGLQLATNLRWFWRASGSFFEGRTLVERALGAATEPSPARARAEVTLGQLAHNMADFDVARRALARGISALDPAAEIDRAWAMSVIAMNDALSMHLDDCEESAREALSIASALNCQWLVVHARLAFGLMYSMRGMHDRALDEMSAADQFAMSAGDLFLESYTRVNLGLQQVLVGDTLAARASFIASLRLANRLGNRRAAAGCFEGYAYTTASDAPALAAQLMGAAGRIRDVTHSPLLPHWVNAHQERWAHITSRLGAERATEEWQRGAATAIDRISNMLTDERAGLHRP